MFSFKREIIKEPLIFEREDWDIAEWNTIRKIFNVKEEDIRIVVEAPFTVQVGYEVD